MKRAYLFTRTLFFIFLISLSYPSLAQSWWILGTAPNPLNYTNGGFAYFATNNSGHVYVGYTNGSNYGSLKIWDGSSWTSTGTLSDYGYLSKVAADDAGNAYVIGNIWDQNGRANVHKWDGSAWSAVGNLNSDYQISTIITDKSGNLYAAMQTGSQANNVWKWDGSSWSQLGTGSNALNVNRGIDALIIDDSGNVYAGGSFTNANGKVYVAKWDGNSWTEIGAGANPLCPRSGGEIYAVAVDPSGNVYASGDIGDSLGAYVAKWDGSSWAIVGDLRSWTDIYSMVADGSGNIYAGGRYTHGLAVTCVAKWDGNTWSVLGAGSSMFSQESYITCMTRDAQGNIYACGGTQQTTTNCVMEYGAMPDAGVSIPVENKKLSIYPNPANNFLNVEAGFKIAELEIINTLGQIVLHKACSAEKESIDLSGLGSGMYFVRMNNVYVQKVVKQ